MDGPISREGRRWWWGGQEEEQLSERRLSALIRRNEICSQEASAETLPA